MPKKPWEQSYNRRNVAKQPRRTSFCIFTEGKTESLYFNAFRLSSARVQCIGLGGGNALHLAREAAGKKRTVQYSGFDQYYLVFDCDDNCVEEIRQAIQLAHRNQIKWIFSNPCFEIWLLLHYALHEAQADRGSIKGRLLKQYIADYHETMPGIYDLLLPLQPDAFRNAERLLECWPDWHKQLHQANPSTNVTELVKRINRFLPSGSGS